MSITAKQSHKAQYGYTDEQLNLFPFLLIWNDCATIETIMKINHKPITSLGLVPYFALACCSLFEYTGFTFEDKEGISPEFLPAIRNRLKLWQGKFGNSAKGFLQTDERQNDLFRDMLRFEFTKSLNIHYNLGIYFDRDRNVIGNTQLFSFMFGFKNLSVEECTKKAFEIGEQAGSIISSTLSGIQEVFDRPQIAINETPNGLLYCDVNTNTTKVFHRFYPKEVSLYLLNLLGLAGFVDHIVLSIVPNNNLWAMRVLYVTVHYCFLGLTHLTNSIKTNHPTAYKIMQKDLENIISSGSLLFNPTFRNCMMHYDLFDKKTSAFLITPENLDPNTPMYGLVESCYPSESYYSFFSKLHTYLAQVEDFLAKKFDFSKEVINELANDD